MKAHKDIDAQGFKIALDLLIKANIPNNGIAEIPFSFGVRTEGESKLSGKVIYLYLRQLIDLYWYAYGFKLLVPIIALILVFLYLLQTFFS